MKNYVQPGNALTVTFTADVVGGDVVILGSLIGVAAQTYASGAEGVINRDGVFAINKDTSVFAEGAAVYWDDTAKAATSVTVDNTLIGVAVNGGAVTGAATVDVLID